MIQQFNFAQIFLIISAISFLSYGMDESTKKKIETKNQRFLKKVGKEDVPNTIQGLNNSLVSLYKQKGLLTEDTNVLVKYIKQSRLVKFQKIGIATWNNRINNGHDLIHIAPEHDELTPEEIESALAHELAHITLHQKHALCPHYYMKTINKSLMFASGTCPIWAPLTLAALTRKKWPIAKVSAIKYEIAGVTVVTAALHSANSALLKNAHEYTQLPPDSPCRIRYPFLQKLEEFECDIIAAYVLPHGGRAGRKLYEKVREHIGDDISSSDHPKLSTRIWYHGKIEQIQDLFETQKEDSSIK